LDLSPQELESLACAILEQDGRVKESLGKVPGLGHEIEKAKEKRELLIKEEVMADL
jgi:hypothetical protein